ncbi:hypothetical protein J6590_024298 [Homalodisca vitripennis]|nr:hypothetical protein J6590_024298 [Homalodisca vitripennis]
MEVIKAQHYNVTGRILCETFSVPMSHRNFPETEAIDCTKLQYFTKTGRHQVFTRRELTAPS